MSAAAALVVALSAFGALVPNTGLLGAASTVASTTVSPHLVLLGVVVVAAASWTFLRGRPRVSATVLAVALAGTVGWVYVVATFSAAVSAAGGSTDPIAALAISRMNGDRADAHIEYEDGLGAAVYLPREQDRPGQPGAPVMLYVHGGGWISGNENDESATMEEFADRGWLVVSIEYSLATAGFATWDVAGPQVGCALARIGGIAARYGGDASRLVLAGDSAGGQLAVTAGWGAAKGTATSSCRGTIAVPSAVVTQYPALDPAGAWLNGFSGGAATNNVRQIGELYTGGTPGEVPERYRALSSDAVVTPDAPPTLVISPDDDSLIPAGTTRNAVRRARDGGVDITMFTLPYANHAYDALLAGSLGDQARISIISNWLTQRGLAP
ncbi:MAG: alpha/beta hydrolase [Rhodococcus sp. (in: high G+C Gram-positive bacteria)]